MPCVSGSRVTVSFALVLFLLALALTSAAHAQLTQTPGPGGVPLAPGAPVQGWTPGGTSFGGTEVAPGPAARSLPMYRTAPGGEPVLVMPPRERRRDGASANTIANDPCGGRGCLPDSLRMTIAASATGAPADAAIDSFAALGAALRACWTPPERRDGVAMSVRFSLRRSGEMMGPPFVTYTAPGARAASRQAAREAITAGIAHCAPFRLAPHFATAVAGRPISVRFVDDRGR
jgi:hypothetical protein